MARYCTVTIERADLVRIHAIMKDQEIAAVLVFSDSSEERTSHF